MDDVKTLTNYSIDLVIVSEEDIENALSTYYKRDAELNIEDIVGSKSDFEDLEVVDEDENLNISEISVESKTAPIVKLVGMILNEALVSRASDIHIEPQEKVLRIRYRVDGELTEALSIPRSNQNAIIARLKILSNMDITENRLPQDGRFKINFRDREVDFRVSVLPTTFGNKIVLRALDRSSLSVGLEKLGFSKDLLEGLQKAVHKPYGMILITGPTGSGKSTTLYSILNEMNTMDRNIVTIEDPVEYQLEGITQIQVNPEIGLGFSRGLKSVLRQSPDIVMVGEIRDSETADIAIKASLTGQLVLSTLHTNDAPSAVTRLVDMNVEPFLIASSVIMTIAQRLCRKICPYCKEEYTVPQSVLEKVAKDHKGLKGKTVFYRGKGCAKCKNTGYLGRMGILETFLIDDKIRELIIETRIVRPE
jgi:type IV pilus assembly protein PilB